MLERHLDELQAAIVREEAAMAAVEEPTPAERPDWLVEPAVAEERAAEQPNAEDAPAAEGEEPAAAEPAPPPPPLAGAELGPAPRRAMRGERLRHPAELRVQVDGGFLTFYGNKQVFTATCGNPRHGRCVLSRTAEPGKRRQQGRPLGLLTAWLFVGKDLESKADHWNRALWPNAALRSQHRELLADVEGADALFDCERPREPGEGPEPEQVA